MKVLILGHGKEGEAAEEYFKTHEKNAEIEVLENFGPEKLDEIKQGKYSSYDIILRSPSVPPTVVPNESSVTKYFFSKCPCPIIGVTATKGKGTTCSLIKALLKAHGEDAYLVGNIGMPAIEVLDKLTKKSVVVYEMSSFQLWDMEKSPHVAVIGVIEPDHLNVHKNYEDYLSAKGNIARYQKTEDYLIFYDKNPDSVRVAEMGGKAKKISYPFEMPESIKTAVRLPGEHNIENAEAAIAAVASFYNISWDEYLQRYEDVVKRGLSSFMGLPHRLEFVRELNGVLYYDDNFSTNAAAMKVAMGAFPGAEIIAIVGGRDKTEYKDLPEIYEILKAEAIKKVILMGESGRKIFKRYKDEEVGEKFVLAEDLKTAVLKAKEEAEEKNETEKRNGTDGANITNGLVRKSGAEKTNETKNIVLMSPAAASFDMFKDVYERGDKYKELVLSLS